MPQNFQSPTLASPPVNGIAVTPADSVALCTTDGSSKFYSTRGIYCGGAGNVQVTFCGDDFSAGSTVVFTLNAGVYYPMRVNRISATNTTATSIVAFI